MKIVNQIASDTPTPQAPASSDASAPVPLPSTIAQSTGVTPNGTFTLAGEDTAGPAVSLAQAATVIGLGWALTCLILSRGDQAVLGAVCRDTWGLFFVAWVVLVSIGRVSVSGGGSYNYDDWDHDHDPMFNIDGTPMCGRLDIYGNPYGVTCNRTDE